MREAVLLLASIILPGIMSCWNNVCICLTWKVKKSSLIFNCKVSNLIWAVTFYDNLQREQGYCLNPRPSSMCLTKYKNVIIHQNQKTNETILNVTGPLDQRMKGNWTCTHGTLLQHATVEVPLLNFNHQEIKTRPDCWPLLLVLTISGFLLFYILSQLFIYTMFSPCIGSSSEKSCLKTIGKKIWMGRRYMIEGITDSCLCLQKNKEFSMKAIKGTFVCLLMVLMIAIPIAVGLHENGMCSENLSFIPIGFIFGFIVRILLMDERGTEREQSFINGCCSLLCERNEEEQTNTREHDNFMDDLEDLSDTQNQLDIRGVEMLSCPTRPSLIGFTPPITPSNLERM